MTTEGKLGCAHYFANNPVKAHYFTIKKKLGSRILNAPTLTNEVRTILVCDVMLGRVFDEKLSEYPVGSPFRQRGHAPPEHDSIVHKCGDKETMCVFRGDQVLPRYVIRYTMQDYPPIPHDPFSRHDPFFNPFHSNNFFPHHMAHIRNDYAYIPDDYNSQPGYNYNQISGNYNSGNNRFPF